MGFFEKMRNKTRGSAEIARQGYEGALLNTNAASAQTDEAERTLRFTETRNAELWSDEEEVIHLESKEELIKAQLTRARSHLHHLEQMTLENAEAIKAQMRLARLKGEESPTVPGEDFSIQTGKAREEVTVLEKQHQDVTVKLSAIHIRIQNREQELRKQFGLTEGE